jgi:hypothetical protein
MTELVIDLEYEKVVAGNFEMRDDEGEGYVIMHARVCRDGEDV